MQAWWMATLNPMPADLLKLGKAHLDMTRVRKKCRPGLSSRPPITPYWQVLFRSQSRVSMLKSDSLFNLHLSILLLET